MLWRIFDLFVQGERPIDRAQGGLGIGLTLVRRLAELHDGTVEAKSEGSGKGSTFIVRLPAAEVTAEPPGVTPRAVTRQSRRILVLEDNDDAREALATALRLLGHEVHEAADGLGAIDVAVKLRPDVALIDIGLPALDGYEVARRLRKDAQRICLVALTGYGQPEDRRRSSYPRCRAPGYWPMSDNEGLADIEAANPFRLSRLHPGIGSSTGTQGRGNHPRARTPGAEKLKIRW
jgi:CheY-like chemotaxis protein